MNLFHNSAFLQAAKNTAVFSLTAVPLAVLLSLHELELAERISDTVVCVAGDRIDRIGTPEEIFTREYIAKLYRMEHGKYDPCFDSLEFVP